MTLPFGSVTLTSTGEANQKVVILSCSGGGSKSPIGSGSESAENTSKIASVGKSPCLEFISICTRKSSSSNCACACGANQAKSLSQNPRDCCEPKTISLIRVLSNRTLLSPSVLFLSGVSGSGTPSTQSLSSEASRVTTGIFPTVDSPIPAITVMPPTSCRFLPVSEKFNSSKKSFLACIRLLYGLILFPDP